MLIAVGRGESREGRDVMNCTNGDSSIECFHTVSHQRHSKTASSLKNTERVSSSDVWKELGEESLPLS